MSRATAAGLGLLADRVLGEPPVQPHPVAALGDALAHLEEAIWRDDRRAGAAHAAAGLALGVGAGALVRSTALTTYLAAAGRALGDAARHVEAALADGDLAEARRRLPALVGRDPSELDEREVCRAVIESVAENTVDAVVATGLWAAVAGAPGAAGHRALNTLDAMVGHRSPRYERYGWASARLDDLAAWVPARATGALVALCRPERATAVLRTVRADAHRHPSPNGGVAEAAFAAALDVRLGGPNRYGAVIDPRPVLHVGGRPVRRADIGRAVALGRDVQLVLAGVLVVGGTAADRRRGRRARRSHQPGEAR